VILMVCTECVCKVFHVQVLLRVNRILRVNIVTDDERDRESARARVRDASPNC